MPETTLMVYDRISTEARNLFKNKNKDYGDSFREDGVLGVLIRSKDKINRAINLCRKEGEKHCVLDESLRDTLIDMANYALMGIICLEEIERMKEP